MPQESADISRRNQTDYRAISHDELVKGGESGGRSADLLISFSNSDALTKLMSRFADVNHDEPMTPVDFRSPAGVRVGQVQY
jgi:hypothetical protein